MNNPSAITDISTPFQLMGILNVTPDSFHDGGRYLQVEDALVQARAMIADGASVLDIGGASSRPGASVVDISEEINRVVPVITAIRKESSIPISIDTTWAKVAAAALDAGADWINDISAGRVDPQIVRVAAKWDKPVILMHSRGTPQTMQLDPKYENVVEEVKEELLQSIGNFLDAGVNRKNIIIDPGIGFGKSFGHNCTLLKNIKEICQLGFPVLLGTSRKSFIGTITGQSSGGRLAGSLGSIATAFLEGIRMFRVHDVTATRDFLNVLHAVR